MGWELGTLQGVSGRGKCTASLEEGADVQVEVTVWQAVRCHRMEGPGTISF